MGDHDGYACELFMGPSLWREQPSPPYAGSKTTFWGFTDLLDSKGSQRGYYNNIHADK